jgi:hypothetical protein
MQCSFQSLRRLFENGVRASDVEAHEAVAVASEANPGVEFPVPLF